MHAAGYELGTVRHRWYPHITLAAPRDQRCRHKLATDPHCVYDEFAYEWDVFYGPEPLSKASAIMEMRAIWVLADQTSQSTERLQSESERRARFRVWTHQDDLESVSAWFSVRRVCKPEVEAIDFERTPIPALGDAVAEPAAKAEPAPRQPARGRRNRTDKPGIWAWRAFVHMEGEGTCLGGPAGALLSAR